ncbi:MAG: ribose 5-phosphate isomerase B [Spirochaetota bacterium]
MYTNKKIIVGSDHGGFELKSIILRHLRDSGLDVEDAGCHSQDSCDYPVYGKIVADKVIEAKCRGILLCGTGIGMSIVANRIPGIRAALCHNEYTARMSRMHNDANILILGARVIGSGLAIDIVNIWLNTEFEGGRHQKRLDLIK